MLLHLCDNNVNMAQNKTEQTNTLVLPSTRIKHFSLNFHIRYHIPILFLCTCLVNTHPINKWINVHEPHWKTNRCLMFSSIALSSAFLSFTPVPSTHPACVSIFPKDSFSKFFSTRNRLSLDLGYHGNHMYRVSEVDEVWHLKSSLVLRLPLSIMHWWGGDLTTNWVQIF